MDIENIKRLVPVEITVEFVQSTIIALDPLKITRGLPARCAPSCLVTPQLGDTVICSIAANQPATILAVVERQANKTPISIQSESAIHFASPGFHFVSDSFNYENW
jgi:hypothetical protein